MARKTIEDMLNEEINRLRGHLKDTLAEVDTLKLNIINLESKVENLEYELDEAGENNTNLEHEIGDLVSQLCNQEDRDG